MAGIYERVRASAELVPLARELDDLGVGRHVPGVAVGVYADGEEHYFGHGVRSVDGGGPVGPGTGFRAASISKVFTATLLMRLAERPAPRTPLDLDRPVADYLPAFTLRDAAAARSVTVRQLATHRGGWVSNFFEHRPADELDDAALDRAVGELAAAEQISPPGRFYSYSNSGFAVLGRVIEAVAGTTFEAAADELLLRPMGLRNTLFPVTASAPAGAAEGHTGSPPAVVRPWSRSRARSPSGGIVTTAADLMTFARCLLDGGGPVLRPRTVAAMWAPEAEAVGFAERIGVGWNLNRLDDGTHYVCHGGNTGGYTAMLSIVPSLRFAVAVLLNSSSPAPVIDRVQDWVTARFIGRTRHRAAPAPTYHAAPPTQDYLGRYTDGTGDVLVTAPAGRVRLALADAGGPTSEVRFTGEDEGVTTAAGTELPVRFLRDADGIVRWLRVTGLVFRRRADA